MTLKIKTVSIMVMSMFYVVAGVHHFINPLLFLQIVPPYLPYPLQLVYISGVCEVILGLILLIPALRFVAGWGLVLLLIAVFPANIYVAQTNGEAMNITPLMAWARLPFQLVLISIAYWHAHNQDYHRSITQ